MKLSENLRKNNPSNWFEDMIFDLNQFLSHEFRMQRNVATISCKCTNNTYSMYKYESQWLFYIAKPWVARLTKHLKSDGFVVEKDGDKLFISLY